MGAEISPEQLQVARRGGVVLVAYDPVWAERYEEAAALIRAACGPRLTGIEHVGSTAVPGLAAKPYLDIMPGVAKFEDMAALAPAMESLGYQSRGEFGIRGRHYFTKWVEGDEHVWKHNVHMYEMGHYEWVRHLVFRDALREDPAIRAEYEALKRELATKHPDDVETYAMSKSELVERIIAARGGPRRPE